MIRTDRLPHPDADVVTEPGTLRAVLYDRVSTENQSESGYSGGDDGFQLDRCRAEAERLGATVVEEIHDVGSGTRWDLPGLDRLFELARARAFNLLIVWDVSRFARNTAKKIVLTEQLKELGVRVHYVTTPVQDGPQGKLTSDLMAVIAD
jgi:DNA invertase Pin-like site-specific DNA recombinase